VSAADALGPQFVRGDEVRVGDRLDSGGKTRVTKVHERGDYMLHATATRGARSPSVQRVKKDEQVRVWRKK